MRRALCSGMPTIKHYRELDCWRLSVELRDAVLAVTARPRVRRNLRFCDQIAGAARSAPSNIAEGFGRSDREFGRYLLVARGSLRETETLLDEACTCAYISPGEHAQLRELAKRAHTAASRLEYYLSPGPKPRPAT